MSGSLQEILLDEFRGAPCFEIQFYEATDLTNNFPLPWQVQLTAYVRFPDK